MTQLASQSARLPAFRLCGLGKEVTGRRQVHFPLSLAASERKSDCSEQMSRRYIRTTREKSSAPRATQACGRVLFSGRELFLPLVSKKHLPRFKYFTRHKYTTEYFFTPGTLHETSTQKRKDPRTLRCETYFSVRELFPRPARQVFFSSGTFSATGAKSIFQFENFFCD